MRRIKKEKRKEHNDARLARGEIIDTVPLTAEQRKEKMQKRIEKMKMKKEDSKKLKGDTHEDKLAGFVNSLACENLLTSEHLITQKELIDIAEPKERVVAGIWQCIENLMA